MESQVGVEPTNSCFADSSLIRLGTATYIGRIIYTRVLADLIDL
jgi:hypothetical protein